MAIVSERLNPKSSTPPPDPKAPPSQKPMTPQNANSLAAALPVRDANADLINQQGDGFFGSFFKQKKRPGVLEAPPTVLKATGNMSEREQVETEVIKLLLLSYFNVVKRTAADLVPKAIMLNLVNQSREDIQRELLAELYKKEAIDETLKESDFTVQRRKECKKMIEALMKADEAIAAV